jgi:hypothetical protein
LAADAGGVGDEDGEERKLIVERTDFTTEVTEDTEKRRGTKGTEGKGSQERKRAGKKEWG